MKKVYKIYEKAYTTLERQTVSFDYGDEFIKCTHFLREIFIEDREKLRELSEGFESLEMAETFIEENIEEYDNWTVVIEYKKEDE